METTGSAGDIRISRMGGMSVQAGDNGTDGT